MISFSIPALVLALSHVGYANLGGDLQVAQKFTGKVTIDPDGHKKSWTGNDICKWDGFFCEVDPAGEKRVASVDFNGFRLGGSDLVLDGFLDALTGLAIFHANSNGFKGEVPNLSALPYLYEVDLSNNKLSGPFPSTLLDRDLSFLDIRYNQFSGGLPDALFQGKSSEVIFLNNNRFSGSIPDTIGDSPALYITLANNKFVGSIPASLGSARNLQEILLLGNKLSGKIPDGLGALKNLTVFDASCNRLTGCVPEDLCGIKALQVLNLTGNALSGDLGPKCQALVAEGILII